MARSQDRSSVESEVARPRDAAGGAEVVPIHRKRELAVAAALLGSSPSMERLRHAIGRAADSHASVLITGQVGTGRSVVAQLIHEGSARPGEFVAVRCGAQTSLPAPLAQKAPRRPGVRSAGRDREPSRVELTTVFLEDIDELTPELQANLVRILDGRTAATATGTPRVIASITADPDAAVATGTIRADLLYRLNALRIRVPSLADRGRADFAELMRAFAKRQPRSVSFDEHAVEWLFNRPWHANVRELENIVQRLTIMTDSETIGVPDLEEHVGPATATDATRALELLIDSVFATAAPAGGRHSSVELAMIARAIEISDNETAAARLLGMDRRIMLRRQARLARGPQPATRKKRA